MVHFSPDFFFSMADGRWREARDLATDPRSSPAPVLTARAHASPGLVYNSVTIVDPTLEGAGTKWWVGCGPGSGLIAPATVRSVTRRGRVPQTLSAQCGRCLSVSLFSFIALNFPVGKMGVREASRPRALAFCTVRGSQRLCRKPRSPGYWSQATGLPLPLEGD